jgi:hypothetical protein
MQKNALESARSSWRLPQPCNTEDNASPALKTFASEIEKDVARHSHLSKLKVERCRYLLFRRTQLQKKIELIDDELRGMIQEDRYQP